MVKGAAKLQITVETKEALKQVQDFAAEVGERLPNDVQVADKAMRRWETGLRTGRYTVNEVKKEVEDFEKRLMDSTRSLEGTSKGVQVLNKHLHMMAWPAAALGVAKLGQEVSESVDIWRDFETQMRRVQVASGASEADFQALKKTAQDLGKSTIFSQSEVAEGMLNLARAGMGVREQQEMVVHVMNLSTAGTVELGEAANTTAKAMSQWGLKASETEATVDLMVRSTNSATQNFQEFSMAFLEGGGSLKSAGFKIKDAALAVSALAKVGYAGDKGGSAVKTLGIELAALKAPTATATKVMNELKLTFDHIDPDRNNLIDVLDRFHTAGMTAVQASQLFGKEAGPKLYAMLSMGRAELEKLSATMDNNASAATAAAGSWGTVDLALKQTGSAIEKVRSDLGERLAPALVTLINLAGQAASALEDLYTPDTDEDQLAKLRQAEKGLDERLKQLDARDRRHQPRLKEKLAGIQDEIKGLADAKEMLERTQKALKVADYNFAKAKFEAEAAQGQARAGAFNKVAQLDAEVKKLEARIAKATARIEADKQPAAVGSPNAAHQAEVEALRGLQDLLPGLSREEVAATAAAYGKTAEELRDFMDASIQAALAADAQAQSLEALQGVVLGLAEAEARAAAGRELGPELAKAKARVEVGGRKDLGELEKRFELESRLLEIDRAAAEAAIRAEGGDTAKLARLEAEHAIKLKILRTDQGGERQRAALTLEEELRRAKEETAKAAAEAAASASGAMEGDGRRLKLAEDLLEAERKRRADAETDAGMQALINQIYAERRVLLDFLREEQELERLARVLDVHRRIATTVAGRAADQAAENLDLEGERLLREQILAHELAGALAQSKSVEETKALLAEHQLKLEVMKEQTAEAHAQNATLQARLVLMAKELGLGDKTAQRLVGNVGGAGSNAGRAMQIGEAAAEAAPGGPSAMAGAAIMQLVMSNERVKESIDRIFGAIFGLVDPFVEVLVPPLEAVATALEGLEPVMRALAKAMQATSLASGDNLANLLKGLNVGGSLGGLLGGGGGDKSDKIGLTEFNAQFDGIFTEALATFTEASGHWAERYRAALEPFHAAMAAAQGLDHDGERQRAMDRVAAGQAAALATAGFYKEAALLAGEIADAAIAEQAIQGVEAISRQVAEGVGESINQSLDQLRLSDYELAIKALDQEHANNAQTLAGLVDGTKETEQALNDLNKELGLAALRASELERATASVQPFADAINTLNLSPLEVQVQAIMAAVTAASQGLQAQMAEGAITADAGNFGQAVAFVGGAAQIQQVFDAAMRPITDALEDQGLDEYQKKIRDIEDHFEELADSLAAANVEAITGWSETQIRAAAAAAAAAQVSEVLEEQAEDQAEAAEAAGEAWERALRPLLDRELEADLGGLAMAAVRLHRDAAAMLAEWGDSAADAALILRDQARQWKGTVEGMFKGALTGFAQVSHQAEDAASRMRGVAGPTLEELSSTLAGLGSLAGVTDPEELEERRLELAGLYDDALGLERAQSGAVQALASGLQGLVRLAQGLDGTIHEILHGELSAADPTLGVEASMAAWREKLEAAQEAAATESTADDFAIDDLQGMSASTLQRAMELLRGNSAYRDFHAEVVAGLESVQVATLGRLEDGLGAAAGTGLMELARLAEAAGEVDPAGMESLAAFLDSLGAAAESMQGQASATQTLLIGLDLQLVGTGLTQVDGGWQYSQQINALLGLVGQGLTNDQWSQTVTFVGSLVGQGLTGAQIWSETVNFVSQLTGGGIRWDGTKWVAAETIDVDLDAVVDNVDGVVLTVPEVVAAVGGVKDEVGEVAAQLALLWNINQGLYHNATGLATITQWLRNDVAGLHNFFSGEPLTRWREMVFYLAAISNNTKTAGSFAVGAWEVPGDMTARIHAGEMIIPAGPAEAIRRMALNPGGGSAGAGPAGASGSGLERKLDRLIDLLARLPDRPAQVRLNITDASGETLERRLVEFTRELNVGLERGRRLRVTEVSR